MRIIWFAVAAIATLGLSACATESPVTPIGNGQYIVSGRDATIFGSEGEKIAELMQKANAYCAKQGLSAVLINSEGHGAKPGTAVTGTWAGGGFTGVHPATTSSATITFRCAGGN